MRQCFKDASLIYLLAKLLRCIQRDHLQTWHPLLSSGRSSVLHRSCLWPSGTAGPHHCRSIRDAGAGLQTGTAAPHYSYPSLLAGPLGARSCHGMGALWVSLYQVCPWHAPPPPLLLLLLLHGEERADRPDGALGVPAGASCEGRYPRWRTPVLTCAPQLPQCIWCGPADPSWGNEALTLRRNAPSVALREALIAEC